MCMTCSKGWKGTLHRFHGFTDEKTQMRSSIDLLRQESRSSVKGGGKCFVFFFALTVVTVQHGSVCLVTRFPFNLLPIPNNDTASISKTQDMHAICTNLCTDVLLLYRYSKKVRRSNLQSGGKRR